jgi:perosamine synthetase
MTVNRTNKFDNGALTAGTPGLPYGRQWITDEDIVSVTEALKSEWLTTGPKVAEFEEDFARFVGTKHAVAVSNGTAALHAAMYAAGIGPGDEVIVPAMTFAATANCVVFQGGTPVFADVEPQTLLIDPLSVESKITSRTKAIYDALRLLADRYKLTLVDDACHALGGRYKGRPVGTIADMSVFSLHPVKHITTGEGGVITTDIQELAQRMRLFRNHGITTDHHQRKEQGSWFYEMVDLGYNYRLTDFQCALGISQLRKLPEWLARRKEIAGQYNEAFNEISGLKPLSVREDVSHAYHLYVVRLDLARLQAGRDEIFSAFRSEGIGVNVHYIPVYLHPFYRRKFGAAQGLCPAAEKAYEQIITLPLFPRMSDSDVDKVINTVHKVIDMFKIPKNRKFTGK